MTHLIQNAPRLIVPGLAAVALLIATPAPAAPPAQIQLTGVIRDFHAYSDPDGHVTMERPNLPNALKPKWVIGNLVEPILGADGLPVFSNNGTVVQSAWKDASGRNIAMQLPPAVPPAAPDVAGVTFGSWNDYLDTASFSDLFQDVPDVNLSATLTLTFNLQADGTYVFDASTDPDMSGGFFPIDGDLFGKEGRSHNYHFTFELHTQFTYVAADSPIFEFMGDDDVWVFIDDRIVVDLGGRHSAKSMYVDLARLGLTNGQTYPLDIFIMERRTSGSNSRLTTSFALQEVGTTFTVSAPYD